MPSFFIFIAMRTKLAFICCFCLLLMVSASAQLVYDFDPTCQKAYNEITSLRLASGKHLLQQARAENPDNLIPDFLESYAHFFELFFNEDPETYQSLKSDFTSILNKLEKGPSSSPFHQYSQAVVLLHKAIVEIKFGEKFSAAWNFKKAFSLIKGNEKKFPDFLPNKIVYGPMQAAVGTIPPNYKWLAGIFGLSGSIKDGMKQMRTVLGSSDPYAKIFFNEIAFYYCYLCFYFENNPDEVFRFIQSKKLDVVNNHLFTYLAANLSINNKKTEAARTIILDRNNSPGYLQTPVWDLELGYAYLHSLNLDKAIEHFSRFVKDFKGKFYVKEAWQKLGFAYYLKGNQKAAESCRTNVLRKGNAYSDADKRAYNESKTGEWPNPDLLKARLLYDGGYFTEALKLLSGKSQANYQRASDQLEFVYRVGRVYDDLNREDEALKFYNITIQQGKNRREYFASRAAWQAGLIMEKRGNLKEAIAYYQACLAMDDHDFKDSIDQRAKAGISRCKGQ